jgi:hypothetical protein
MHSPQKSTEKNCLSLAEGMEKTAMGVEDSVRDVN